VRYRENPRRSVTRENLLPNSYRFDVLIIFSISVLGPVPGGILLLYGITAVREGYTLAQQSRPPRMRPDRKQEASRC
jgi:hypothetical protein